MKCHFYLVPPLLIATLGCLASDPELTRHALRTQAEQNQMMAQLQREIAAGAHELTAADADARLQSIKLHEHIQAERTRLNEAWKDLQSHRRREAVSQRTDSFLESLVRGGGAIAAALFAIGVVRSVLQSRAEERDTELAALVLDELSIVSDARDADSHTSIPPLLSAKRLACKLQEKQ